MRLRATLLILPALLAGCGDGGEDLPGDSVARVGDQPITRAQFAHWYGVAARSQSSDGGAASLPDPPTYARCVAAARESLSKLPAGRKPVSDQRLKQSCEQRHRLMRGQVMQFLISAAWVQREAAEQRIEVTDAEVEAELERSKKRSLRRPGAYRDLLRRAGMSEADARFKVRIGLLSSRLRKQATSAVEQPTDRDAAAYYREHREIFSQGEGRTVRVVKAKSRARAKRARNALSSGRSWRTVARRYSTDPGTVRSGGLMALIEDNRDDTRVDPQIREAVFNARRGALEGPLEAESSHYVFQVIKISPPTDQSLGEARANIKQFLTLRREKNAVAEYSAAFRTKWKARTDCRTGFVIQDCEGAPETQRTTAAN